MYPAHSGLRYLVLLAGLVAVAYLAYGLVARRPHDRPARIVTAAFVGLLDLQLLLGILTLQVRPVYPALTGHIVMMVLAAVAAHGLSIAAKRSPDPRRKYALALAGVGVALLLIAGGITAIGRGVFESTLS